MRLVVCIVISLLMSVAVVHLLDLHERNRVLGLSKGNPRILAELLIRREGAQRRRCAGEGGRWPSELDVLMLAIATVEQHATTRLERLVESVAIRGAAILGLPVPDLSIGDGQIRVSTAMTAIQSVALSGPMNHVDWNGLALALLSRCGNHRLGVGVLTWIAKQQGLSMEALDRASILKIAATYNGQAEPRGIAELLAQHTYRELIFHLYHAHRFAMLRNG